MGFPLICTPLLNKFVISTGAYPDFLPRRTGQCRVCGSPLESRKIFINATKLNRKSGVARGEIRGFLRPSHLCK
jgi:hypothetical protein